MDGPIAAATRHLDAPGIAADLAILNEASFDVWFDIEIDLLPAKRTGDEKVVRIHLRRVYRFGRTPQSDMIVLFPNTQPKEACDGGVRGKPSVRRMCRHDGPADGTLPAAPPKGAELHQVPRAQATEIGTYYRCLKNGAHTVIVERDPILARTS